MIPPNTPSSPTFAVKTMPNFHRGEIEAYFDDTPHTLVLTLGALAELEAAFGAADMLALAERFSHGRISARDATRIIGAGLRGAGQVITDEDVSRLRAQDGAAGCVAIVARLLTATFGQATATTAQHPPTGPSLGEPKRGSAVEAPDPFPGPR
jgi:Phage tail tube protein, GTA-gp10